MADAKELALARTQALKSGDHRAALEALRDVLADSLKDAGDNVKAQIAAQLRAVLSELAALPAVERTEVDDLTERRKTRRSRTDAELRTRQKRGA
jgi:hypothetical protein